MGPLTEKELKDIQRAAQAKQPDLCHQLLKKHEGVLRQFLIDSLADRLHTAPTVTLPNKISDTNPKVQQEFEIAFKQQRHGNFSGAIESLQKAINLNPGDSRLREWLAAIYIKQGDYPLAKRVLEQEIRGWHSSVKNWNLAYVYRLEENNEKAFAILAQSFEERKSRGARIGPSLLRMTMFLALELNERDFLLHNLPRLDQLEAYALGFIIAYEEEDATAKSEYICKLGGEPTEPIDDTFSPPPVSQRLTPNIRKLGGEPTEPTDDTLIPPPVSLRLTPERITDLGLAYIQRNLVPDGIQYFERRVRTHTSDWASQQQLGNLYAHNGQYDRAAECYVKEFEIGEKNPKLHISTKQRRLLGILTFYREHGLASRGLYLLEKASKLGIYPKKTEAFRREFTVAQQKSDDAIQILLEAQAPMQRISNVTSLTNQADLVRSYCEALARQFGDEASSVTGYTHQLVELFETFARASDFGTKSGLAQSILEKHAEFERAAKDIRTERLKDCLVALRKPMRYVVNDVSLQTGGLPKPKVRILNTFLPQENVITSVLVEILNDTRYDITAARIGLRSLTGGYECVGSNSVEISCGIPAGEATIVTFSVRQCSSKPLEQLTVHLVFSTESLDDVTLDRIPEFQIPVKKFTKVIAKAEIENPYITIGAIPYTRPENFHGRDDILSLIRGGVAGGELREALFLSGLRRVGKTSVLQFLLGNAPSGTIPVYIRLDELSPKSTGELLLGMALKIQDRIAELSLDTRGDLQPQLGLQDLEVFDAHPSMMFSDFLNRVNKVLQGKKLFLMLDEFQVVTEGIAKNRLGQSTSTLDIDALDIIRGHLEGRSFYAILTGSLLFEEICAKTPGYDRLWGSIKVQDVAFIAEEAVKDVLREPTKKCGIFFTDSAVNRVMDYTQGYPVFVQLIGVEVIGFLNQEQRTVVSPQDIDAAARTIVTEQDHLFHFWWDPRRLNRSVDGNIIQIILEHQSEAWAGLPRSELVQAMLSNGFREEEVNKRIERLKKLHILGQKSNGNLGINALLLERWLSYRRECHGGILPFGRDAYIDSVEAIVGVFADYENIYFELAKLRRLRSGDHEFMRKTSIPNIARKLFDRAASYGNLQEPWAVADWYVGAIGQEQHARVFRQAMWDIHLPKLKGKQKSDHALRDLVLEKVDDRPDINVCILATGDGDLSELATNLLKRHKRVIVWSMRSSVHSHYEDLAKWGKIQIEYVDDILAI